MYDDAWFDRFEKFGPTSKNLSLLLRPSIIALDGHEMVWGDWSAIEARKLPWLANSQSARKVLKVFDGNDNDRMKPDIYMIEYCNLSGKDPQETWLRYMDKDKDAKNGRQQGKVSVLSLGFGGSVGALMRMAVNYGVYYDEATARHVVEVWRAANPWARNYWDDRWTAATSAIECPDTPFPAGRTVSFYDKTYLKGTLFTILPSGRKLAYPTIRWEKKEMEDPDTGKTYERKTLTYRKGYGRSSLWYGKFAENDTQAAAADLLRNAKVKMEETAPYVVGHTHDELIGMPPVGEAEAFAAHLEKVMKTAPDYAIECPLAVEVSRNWYYTKAED